MFFKPYFHLLKRIFQPPTVSQEYCKWRHNLLLSRLPWLIWITLIALSLIILLDLLFTIPSLNASGDPTLMFGDERLFQYLQSSITQILAILLCALLLRYPPINHHPKYLFLLISIGLLLIPQIIATSYGKSEFSPIGWILFYAVQAILIPVHWRLHLSSQIIVIGYFMLMTILGFKDPNITLVSKYWMGGFYVLLICIVADLGVFLYEKSLKKELDLRQQLQGFVHAVSHDLRNPVLGMVMTLKTLVNSSGEDAKIPQELLSQLIYGCDRQISLINTLLETHSTEVNGINLHCQPTDINNLLNSVLTDYQPFFQSSKTTITQEIDPNLPLVNADSLHLRRVYENLIYNAIKYNRPGINLNFKIEMVQSNLKHHQKGNYIRCTISDNGAGMTQEQCNYLFNPYNSKPKHSQGLNLDLALYMCKLIIDEHGGKIGIVSNCGSGSTFWFTLPI